jgi:hypothetical protein
MDSDCPVWPEPLSMRGEIPWKYRLAVIGNILNKNIFGRNRHANSILENHSRPFDFAESSGHGADDAQPRYRQYSQRAHGGVLHAACIGWTHYYRGHVALTERLGLPAHTGNIFTGPNRRLETHYRCGAFQRCKDLHPAHALRANCPSAESARWGMRAGAFSRGSRRRDVHGCRGDEAASGAQGNERGGH